MTKQNHNMNDALAPEHSRVSV
uniref:Uncharacterized protein n=1 Tax=Arundo donax TaxID=35708 RepID=A0A0A9GNN4_ARUDO